MSKQRKKQRHRKRRKGPVVPMLLTAYNYKLLVLGAVLILAGFGGMYLEGQQYGIYSLYVAPLLVMAGFVIVAVSVFKTDPKILEAEEKDREQTPESPSSSGSG